MCDKKKKKIYAHIDILYVRTTQIFGISIRIVLPTSSYRAVGLENRSADVRVKIQYFPIYFIIYVPTGPVCMRCIWRGAQGKRIRKELCASCRSRTYTYTAHPSHLIGVGTFLYHVSHLEGCNSSARPFLSAIYHFSRNFSLSRFIYNNVY